MNQPSEEPAEGELLNCGRMALSIHARAIMDIANKLKDWPSCRELRNAIIEWDCKECGYGHCPRCRCHTDCDCAPMACVTWEKCGLNEATVFLMEALPGMTLEQSKGLLGGSYKLGGQSANELNPDATIYLYQESTDFANQAILRLNSWGSPSKKEEEE